MNILFYHPAGDKEGWLPLLKRRLPHVNIYPYQDGANPLADYALIWQPHKHVLAKQNNLKAIFVLGAGVDAILDQLAYSPELLPKNVPIYRLEDAGMALQMQEYAIATVMRYFRRLDEYERQQRHKQWQALPIYSYDQFIIGVMGLGILGKHVASSLSKLGFTVKGWSRSKKSIDGIACYDQQQLDEFVCGTKLLINLLPSTPQTQGILNANLFAKLADNAYIINLARGKHLIEQDLLAAMLTNKIKAATLDVFNNEPLSTDHPFWQHPAITITPHISALTLVDNSVSQIIDKILQIEKGETVANGLIDLDRGY